LKDLLIDLTSDEEGGSSERKKQNLPGDPTRTPIEQPKTTGKAAMGNAVVTWTEARLSPLVLEDLFADPPKK
jgi:hypothetical protein